MFLILRILIHVTIEPKIRRGLAPHWGSPLGEMRKYQLTDTERCFRTFLLMFPSVTWYKCLATSNFRKKGLHTSLWWISILIDLWGKEGILHKQIGCICSHCDLHVYRHIFLFFLFFFLNLEPLKFRLYQLLVTAVQNSVFLDNILRFSFKASCI